MWECHKGNWIGKYVNKAQHNTNDKEIPHANERRKSTFLINKKAQIFNGYYKHEDAGVGTCKIYK